MTSQQQEAVFREWVAEHQGVLTRAARAFAEAQDRDDLLQEMLLALWHAIPAFREASSPRTYVYRIAHNTALTWLRARLRRPLQVELEAAAEPAVSADDHHVALHAAIRRLPDLDRTLVLLHLDGLSYQEMAAVLGLSESNVGTRLTRARSRPN